MKMTEFRSQQPLNDDDFATIRRNVMTTIAARRERRFLPIMMRFALVAAAVIAIGFVFLRRPAPPTAIAIKKPATVIHVPPAPTVVASVTVPHPVTPVAHRPRHRRVHPQSMVALAAQQNIRVEFRTSDPDIRIIWIANQTPNTTGGKS